MTNGQMLITVPLAAVAGLFTGTQLDSYGVPMTLTAPLSVIVALATMDAMSQWLTRRATHTHRCQDCDFQVQVTHVSAAESRYWQETAAAHPHHQL